MNSVVTLLYMSAPLVPFLIIYFVGAFFCIFHWQRHPTRSCLALLAFMLFVLRVCAAVASNWLMMRKDDFEWDAHALTLRLGLIGICDNLVAIAAWILLLIALFMRHDSSNPIVLKDEATKNEGHS